MGSLKEALKKAGFKEEVKKEKTHSDRLDNKLQRGTLTQCRCCSKFFSQSQLPINLALQNAVDDIDRCENCCIIAIVCPDSITPK